MILTSKKFYYAVVGLGCIVLAVYLKAEAEVIFMIGGIVSSLIVGQGLSDNGSKRS